MVDATANADDGAARRPAPEDQAGPFERARNYVVSGFGDQNEHPVPPELEGILTQQTKARMLYEFCIASNRRVGESTHNLFAIAEHYAEVEPVEIEKPETINGVPPFFTQLTKEEKSNFCYNQVIETLASEALPVTVESLRATKRADPYEPTSSFAGRFVQRVTSYVVFTLIALFAIYALFLAAKLFFPEAVEKLDAVIHLDWIAWIAFGCIGALVHLLNHALTTTRLKTFELSEERKVGPRILLGGMFGFVLPWILTEAGPLDGGATVAVGSITAFFGGYSVRFSIGLLERVLSALFPETKPTR